MKLAVYSDLHLEFDGPAFDLVEDDADVLVLAGDIGIDDPHMMWIREQAAQRPVIYVAGNHEFYGFNYPERLENLRAIFKDTRVHFLEQDAVEIGGYRFLGCTLWTDFELGDDRAFAMYAASQGMADFREIRYGPKRFSPQNSVRIHEISMEWLGRQIAQGDREKTVVVTHHPPHQRSMDPFFKGSTLNPAFGSHHEKEIRQWQPALWIHGHTHYCVDYQVGETRIVSNQRGYYPHEIDPKFSVPFLVEV